MNLKNVTLSMVFAVCLLCGIPSGYSQEKPKVLVVYYSRDGHTHAVAEALAKKFDATIERLIDKKKRIGPVAMPVAGRDAISGNLTQIDPVRQDPATYDIILLGTPSWFGNPTPAIRTYLSQHDLSLKKVGVFGTAHLTGVEDCLEKLAELAVPGKARMVPRLPLRHRDLGEDVLPQKIETFYQQMVFSEQ